MKLSYDYFDVILEKEMGDTVFGGDVTQHLFYYYSDKLFDDELLHVIRNEWVEEDISGMVDTEELYSITEDKVKLIEYLISEGSIQSKNDIVMDSLFVSSENPGRIAYRKAKIHQ